MPRTALGADGVSGRQSFSWPTPKLGARDGTQALVALSTVLAAAILATIAAFAPVPATLLVAGLVMSFALVRLGPDPTLIWLMILPWQFLPGVSTNILLNPWVWVALWRLILAAQSRGDTFQPRLPSCRPRCMAVWTALLLPAGYLLQWLLFGVNEPSLLAWMVPYLPLVAGLFLLPLDPVLVRRHLFYLGTAISYLVLVESFTGISLNSLIESNLSVQEYMRSGRALGPTGNPLFTSSILITAFFLPVNSSVQTRLAQVVILVATVLTGSKSAIIGLAIGLILLAFSKSLKHLAAACTFAILVICGIQLGADATGNNVFKRFAVFSDLRSSDPDRAFTTDFVLQWVQNYPFGGMPIGSALMDKRQFSPVNGGARFGIESTWLAVASDTGLIFVGLTLILIAMAAFKYRRDSKIQALAALVVSLFFWNGLFGAWVIVPLFLILVLAPTEASVGQARRPHETEPALLHRKWQNS